MHLYYILQSVSGIMTQSEKLYLLNNMENLIIFHVFFLIIIPFGHRTFLTSLPLRGPVQIYSSGVTARAHLKL